MFFISHLSFFSLQIPFPLEPNNLFCVTKIRNTFVHAWSTNENILVSDADECITDTGIEAYNREDYKDAISHFEEALKRFYEEEEGCRALCEGEYDVGKEYSDIPTPFHLQIVCKDFCMLS